MNHTTRRNELERGQTAVLFALMLIGLILFVGLAVDGGNAFNERRITQNAADSAALGGVHYIAASDSPNETELQRRINTVVESNGVPDTNNNPGDDVNDNVVAYYTDSSGSRLPSPNCNLVGSCGGVPNSAFGIEVEVANTANTYFLGLIGRNNLGIGGGAVAVIQGNLPSSLADNVMIALGQCGAWDRQMTGRGDNSEFLGGLYTNSYFDATGKNNHFHGQVTYVDYLDPPRYGTNNEFQPGLPVEGAPLPNPFPGWSYTDFAPGTPIAVANAGNYWDVSILDRPSAGIPGVIEMSEIIDQTVYPELYNPDNKDPLTARDGVILQPNQMRTGIYYAGDKEIRIGETASGGQVPQGTNGTVTIVSGNRIKTTEKAMNLSAYMGQGSAFPGLLFFSDYEIQADPCVFDTSIDPVINMAGNDNGLRPVVYHYPDDIPKKANPADYVGCPYPRLNGCYVPSNAVFTGLIYAPNGRVDTSDTRTTYIGAIVAYTIDYSGDDNLFVHNPALFPTSNPAISLER
jgi:hypothetical protein